MQAQTIPPSAGDTSATEARLRASLERLARLADDHPLALVGSAIASGVVLGSLLRNRGGTRSGLLRSITMATARTAVVTIVGNRLARHLDSVDL